MIPADHTVEGGAVRRCGGPLGAVFGLAVSLSMAAVVAFYRAAFPD